MKENNREEKKKGECCKVHCAVCASEKPTLVACSLLLPPTPKRVYFKCLPRLLDWGQEHSSPGFMLQRVNSEKSNSENCALENSKKVNCFQQCLLLFIPRYKKCLWWEREAGSSVVGKWSIEKRAHLLAQDVHKWEVPSQLSQDSTECF